MSVFYNEIDPGSAEWLRYLINAGEIPEGVVDERDIRDISPAELRGYTQCHFFAGIGGWAYALRLAGWPVGRRVWTGSCPCQPFSVAGKGGGLGDERHLWPAFRWLVAQCRPATVFGEQVASEDGRDWMSGVRDDLEVMGYAVGSADLCAAGVGAPHIRQRLFWVADGHELRLQGQRGRGERGIAKCHSFGRMADDEHAGPQGRIRRGPGAERESLHRHAGCDGGVDWSCAIWWPCGDGKLRRVPARRVGNPPGDDEQRDTEPAMHGERLAAGGPGGTAGRLGDCAGKRRGEAGASVDRCAERPSEPSGFGRLSDTPNDGHEREPGARKWGPGVAHPSGGVCDGGRGGCGDFEVEPGLFPLADGLPGCVAVVCAGEDESERRWISRRAALFGSGNAIVPELAAEFVKAYVEVENQNQKRK